MTAPIKIRPVLAGDNFVLTVEGGVIRRPVPEDGLVIEGPDSEIFLPVAKVHEALRVLTARREPGARARRSATPEARQLDLPAAPVAWPKKRARGQAK